MDLIINLNSIRSLKDEYFKDLLNFIGLAKLKNIKDKYDKKGKVKSKGFKLNSGSLSADFATANFIYNVINSNDSTKNYENVLIEFEKKFIKAFQQKTDIDLNAWKERLATENNSSQIYNSLYLEIDKCEALDTYQRSLMRKVLGAQVPDSALSEAKKQIDEEEQKKANAVREKKRSDTINATAEEKLDNLRQSNQSLNTDNQKLRNQIDDLEKQLDDAKTANANLSKQVTDLNERLKNITDKLDAIRKDIPETVDNNSLDEMLAGIKECLLSNNSSKLKQLAINLYIYAHMTGDEKK